MQFKKWIENTENIGPFPGSTVQQIVYHGTDKPKFDQFSYQKSKRFILFSEFDVEAKGFFFSESPHDALGFGKNVVACYLNLKNPLIDPRHDKNLGRDRLPYQKEIHLQKILSPMIEKDQYGYYIELGVGKFYLKNKYREFGHQWIYDAIGSNGLSWDALDNPGVIQKMSQLGYDGTFVEESETYTGRSIFVIKPEQIKMINWFNNPQPSWGEKDQYGTKMKDGFSHFYHEPEF